MNKKMLILGILSIILILLMVIKSQNTTPVTSLEDDSSSEYKMVEYKIRKITDNQFYGRSEDGTKIVFSSEIIDSGEKIQVDDIVICYFEKDNIGKGLVKVEKKEK